MYEKRILKYAKCCVNLYGVVSIQDIINIIKHYEYNEPTRKDVLKTIESYITSRTAMQLKHNIVYNKKHIYDDDVMSFHKRTEKNPFYYPDLLELFFKYESASYYEETAGFGYLFEYLYEAYQIYYDPAEEAHREMDDLASTFRVGTTPDEVIDILKSYPDFEEIFIDQKKVETLLQILTTIYRNSRLYSYKGYTLNELNM